MEKVNIIRCEDMTIYLPTSRRVDSVQFIDLYERERDRGASQGEAVSAAIQKMGL